VALFAIAASFAVGLLGGEVTVAGILAALSIGRIVGLLVRLVSGQPSVAPTGHKVASVLEANGFELRTLRADSVEEHRRYIAEAEQGPLGVLVLDRDTEGAGALARAIDQIRTREEVRPRQAVTMRTAVNQITLQSLAVSRAGVRTPKLRKVLKVNTEATALVFDHVPGTALSNLRGDDISDDMLQDLWRQLRRLRRNQVAHRRLSGRTILVSDSGKIWLLDPSGGEVAAPDLAHPQRPSETLRQEWLAVDLAGVEVEGAGGLGSEVGVAGEDPGAVLPGFDRVGGQPAPDGGAGDGGDDALLDGGAGEVGALPAG
jgi:glycosyltransferase 2 family protein